MKDSERALLDECRETLSAVLGHGYSEASFPAGQDYVSKKAIEKVRRMLAKLESVHVQSQPDASHD